MVTMQEINDYYIFSSGMDDFKEELRNNNVEFFTQSDKRIKVFIDSNRTTKVYIFSPILKYIISLFTILRRF